MKTTIVMITLIIASQMVRADVASQIVKLPPNQGPRLRLGPKPPIERFPPQPYIAPPTPEERAERKAEIQAMAALRERRQAAVAQILEQAAIVTNGLTKAQLVEARVQVLEAAATVTSKGGAKLSLVSAVAAKRQVGEIGEVEIGGRR